MSKIVNRLVDCELLQLRLFGTQGLRSNLVCLVGGQPDLVAYRSNVVAQRHHGDSAPAVRAFVFAKEAVLPVIAHSHYKAGKAKMGSNVGLDASEGGMDFD